MPYVEVIGHLSCVLFIFLVTLNAAGRRRQERESLFSIGQTLRIKKGPLKGYLCRVVRMYRNDITVKLDSLVKLLTGLLGCCCFILALFCLFSCKWLSLIMFGLDNLIHNELLMVLLSLVDITQSESRDSCECLILSTNSPNSSNQILLGFAFCNFIY